MSHTTNLYIFHEEHQEALARGVKPPLKPFSPLVSWPIVSLALVLFITTLIWSAGSIAEEVKLRSSGVSTLATVVKKYVEQEKDSSSNHFIQYTYTPRGATSAHLRTSHIAFARWQQTCEGCSLSVIYDPADPTHNLLDVEQDVQSRAFILIALGALTLGLAWMWRRERNIYRRAERLHSEGQLRMGTMLDVSFYKVENGESLRASIKVQFDVDDTPLTTISDAIKLYTQPPEPQQRVFALYIDPDTFELL
jgi:hypothetical protein